jgi:hypothetical protein
MTVKPDTETGEIKPTFASWLAEHRHGVADLDLTDALRDLVAKVAATRKPGSLTIKIAIKAEADMLAIADSLTVKEPNLAEPSLYWIDREGDLTRNNPLQPRLPFDKGEST